jgi:hypothetical protein
MGDGLPSKNPLGRIPFHELIVGKTGVVERIVFFNGASPSVQDCLRTQIESYKFSSFENDERLTVHVAQFPNCVVSELHLLY